jgi:hypothetical protein
MGIRYGFLKGGIKMPKVIIIGRYDTEVDGAMFIEETYIAPDHLVNISESKRLAEEFLRDMGWIYRKNRHGHFEYYKRGIGWIQVYYNISVREFLPWLIKKYNLQKVDYEAMEIY